MMDYPVVIVPLSEDDGGGWAGFAPDLPGCMSDGETRAEAAANVENAILEWLDACNRMGQEAPKPGSAGTQTFDRLKTDLAHAFAAPEESNWTLAAGEVIARNRAEYGG